VAAAEVAKVAARARWWEAAGGVLGVLLLAPKKEGRLLKMLAPGAVVVAAVESWSAIVPPWGDSAQGYRAIRGPTAGET
jgi:hypothetical protein